MVATGKLQESTTCQISLYSFSLLDTSIRCDWSASVYMHARIAVVIWVVAYRESKGGAADWGYLVSEVHSQLRRALEHRKASGCIDEGAFIANHRVTVIGILVNPATNRV